MEYDVIVVDTDSTFDNEKAALIASADKVIMVVDQTRKSVYSMNTIMRNMNCTDKDKYFFICNRFNLSFSAFLDLGFCKMLGSSSLDDLER